MKTLFKPLIVLMCAAVAFSSCMKDNSAENEAEQRRQEEAIIASLAADEIKIDAYIAAHPSESPEGWQEDSREETFPLVGKTVKTGIHFDVLAEPTAEDDEAYTYEIASGGRDVVRPTVRVNYRVFLLDSDEDDEPVQSGEDEKFDFETFHTSTSIYNNVWVYSFFPKSYRIDGRDEPYVGLTAKGLKKGSHIRVISPSLWAFQGRTVEDIPANSPLVYEFEVLDIE